MKVAVSTAKERIYIPSCLKNKKAAEQEQIKIIYMSPTQTIKDKVLSAKMNYIKGDSGEMEPSMSVNLDKKDVISALLIRIENFFYYDKKDSTKETEVCSVSDLFEAPLESGAGDLVDDIYKFFMEVLNGKVISEKN